VRDLCSSAAALQDLETEFSQLQEDREILRKIIPSGNSKVSVTLFRSTFLALIDGDLYTLGSNIVLSIVGFQSKLQCYSYGSFLTCVFL